MIKEKFDELISRVKEEVILFYGDKLISLAVFGSAASGTMVLDSDLDLFICVDGLSAGRRARIKEFQAVEKNMQPFIRELRSSGIQAELSPVIKTPAETKAGGLIFIDMTETVKILYDKGDFLRIYLEELKNRLHMLGSKKIKIGSAWFWDLVPNYKLIGEVSI